MRWEMFDLEHATKWREELDLSSVLVLVDEFSCFCLNRDKKKMRSVLCVHKKSMKKTDREETWSSSSPHTSSCPDLFLCLQNKELEGNNAYSGCSSRIPSFIDAVCGRMRMEILLFLHSVNRTWRRSRESHAQNNMMLVSIETRHDSWGEDAAADVMLPFNTRVGSTWTSRQEELLKKRHSLSHRNPMLLGNLWVQRKIFARKEKQSPWIIS